MSRSKWAVWLAGPTFKSLSILLSSWEHLTKLAELNKVVMRDSYRITMPEHARTIVPPEYDHTLNHSLLCSSANMEYSKRCNKIRIPLKEARAITLLDNFEITSVFSSFQTPWQESSRSPNRAMYPSERNNVQHNGVRFYIPEQQKFKQHAQRGPAVQATRLDVVTHLCLLLCKLFGCCFHYLLFCNHVLAFSPASYQICGKLNNT
jgi:hypothetical protein